MSDLVKGQKAKLPTIENLRVTMGWTTAADFDLAVLTRKDGDYKLFFFGNKGSVPEGIVLGDDQGVGDTGGDNEETATIVSFDYDEAVVLGWDYGAIQHLAPARFNGSDLHLAIQDQDGNVLDSKFDCNDESNVAAIVRLRKNALGMIEVENCSKSTFLKGMPTGGSPQLASILANNFLG